MNNLELMEIAQEVIEIEGAAAQGISMQLDESFIKVVRAIAASEGKVFVTGSGTSATIARRMAHLLAVTGTPALFLPAMDALHGTMGAAESDDFLIAISKGGESDEINTLVALLKKKGLTTVALTESETSSLAGEVDISCVIHTEPGADPWGVIAMGSTLASAIWGDALIRTLMRLRGWAVESSLEMHPAGAVGKRSQQDEDSPIGGNRVP